MIELLDWAKDRIYTKCDLTFSFWDRVKILFGAKVNFNVRVTCENAVGKTETESDIHVWFPRKPKMEIGNVEISPPYTEYEEPSLFDMETALAFSGSDETFFKGWTVRRCLDCRKPVAGGPTCCMDCALGGKRDAE